MDVENNNTVVDPTNTNTDTEVVDNKTVDNKTVENKEVKNTEVDPLNLKDDKVDKVESTSDFSSYLTGDPSFDVPISFLEANGFSPTDPAVVKSFNGDFADIKEILKTKNIKGSDQMLALAETAYANFKAAQEAEINANTKNVEDILGGKDNLKEMQVWLKKNATESEINELQAMFHGSKLSSIAAALLAKHLYVNSKGLVTTEEKVVKKTTHPADVVNKNKTNTSSDSTSKSLSPTQFKAKVAELYQKYHGNYQNTEEYKQAVQQRTLYR